MSHHLWYALKVRPRFERTVVAHLQARGYDPFLPTYTAKRRWSDRTKSVESALFPGYLFCQLDITNRLPILTAPGVNFIVGVGKAPEAISDSEIESIRSIVKSGLRYEPYPYLSVGQLVRVEEGALMGLVGFITDLKNSSRLVISVNLLMRSVSAEIDRNWVKPLENEGRVGTCPSDVKSIGEAGNPAIERGLLREYEKRHRPGSALRF